MIHEPFPWRLRNEFFNVTAEPKDLVFDFSGGSVLAQNGEGIAFPTMREWSKWQGSTPPRLQYTLRLDREENGEVKESIRCFLALRKRGEEVIVPDNRENSLPWLLHSVHGMRDSRPIHLAFAMATAKHLYGWYSSSRFCGTCGAPLEFGTKERSMICPVCEAVEYPRIGPCILAAVTDGDRLLLTRYARQKGNLVLVAGFMEIGETAEQCVAREVLEETGVRVKNIRYAGSQPWGFSGVVSMAFTAELDGSAAIKVDDKELSEAFWMRREEIPDPPYTCSLTSELIRSFKRGEY